MKLVIGGYASGKREYVSEKFGYDNTCFGSDIKSGAPVIYGVEEWDIQNVAECLNILASKDVVICCEVGLGLVPIDKTERAHRENVGRLSIELAKVASEVHRVYAGIGTRIK